MLKKILALLCAVLLCPAALAQEADTPLLQVHQMALGYADGYLIRFGDINIMVDGGEPNPKKPERLAVDCLRALGVDKLDAYIITHWHQDHCMNMNLILEEFGDADTIVYSPAPEVPEKVVNGSVTVAMSPLANGTHRQMQMGDVLTWGDLVLTCIGPEKLKQNGGCNQDSLNFVLQYGERKFLFVGDFAQSNCINHQYAELCADVDVLKFPHHGSTPYEIGNKACRLVSPEYVLVPGVASQQKLWEFIAGNGVPLQRENILTYAGGHVVILTDGGERFDVLLKQEPSDYAPENN